LIFFGLYFSINQAFGQEANITEKPLSALSLAHLYEKMSAEPALVETDVRTYLANLNKILHLGDDVGQMPGLLADTGWTENRLVYVVTKMNLGLMALFDPQNPRLKDVPDFAKPLPMEEEMIKAHRDDFSRAISRLTGTRPGR
jgi:hypothetical protein